MLVLGITGGVGAGKSTVLDYMKDMYGAAILQTDLAAHELMKKGTSCHESIVAAFGTEILLPNGELDRQKLGAVVFGNKEKLERLNGIVHPAVKQHVREVITEERAKGERKVLAVEAALLIEDHYDEVCDELWYIYASEEIRRERLKTTRDYSDERIDGIFKSQSPEEVFRAHCAVTIDTGISLECTKEQVDQALQERSVERNAE